MSNLYYDVLAALELAHKQAAAAQRPLARTCPHSPPCKPPKPAPDPFAAPARVPSLTIGEMVKQGLLPASVILGRKA